MQKGFTPVIVLIGILVITAIAGGAYYFFKVKTPTQKACTMDAKICPDGLSVGRIGPNCEFAPCPSPKPSTKTRDNYLPSPTIVLIKPRDYVIPGGKAMAPDYITGQIWLYKDYASDNPKRFDAIIIKDPHPDPLIIYVKRIIGLPNEKFRISNRRIYINGSVLDESSFPITETLVRPGQLLKENEEITIPENSYILLGDNREYSLDSRDWGSINRNMILGKLTTQIQKTDTPQKECSCWDGQNNFCLPQIACQ